MTEQEAIKFLTGYLDSVVYKEKCVEAHKLAFKALEKQIPKKPIQKNDVNFKEGKCFYCPNCKGSLATNEDDTYYNYWLSHCNNCGQAIDWGDGD